MIKLHFTIFITPVISTLLHWAGLAFFRLSGWTVEGRPPDDKKFILIGAPHTSNWDFVYMIMLVFLLKLNVHWLGKSSIFRFPFRGIMHWLGGIPVDRTKSANIVDSVVEAFENNEDLKLVISPEGTRRKVEKWRTGFYYIALGSKVPLVLGYIDNKNRVLCFGKVFVPTGDVDADMREIKNFYKDYLSYKQGL